MHKCSIQIESVEIMQNEVKMPHTKQRQQAEAGAALTLWTMLTAIAVCGSYLLAWVFLLILSWLQG